MARTQPSSSGNGKPIEPIKERLRVQKDDLIKPPKVVRIDLDDDDEADEPEINHISDDEDEVGSGDEEGAQEVRTISGDLPARVIQQCVRVALMLVKSPRITGEVNAAWVQRCFWRTPDALQNQHYTYIATVVNALRPFYPQDVEKGVPAKRHILLSINMVVLANYLLAKLGYPVSVCW